MGLIKNAINFGNGFNIGAVAPIDSRMRVEKVADLTTAWTADMPAYKGMIVTVMETSEVYVLKDADNYTSLDSWVKLGSASGAAAGAADALTKANAYTDQKVNDLATGAVQTNTNAISTLNGNASTEGSVAYAVAAEKTRAMAAEKANADAIAAETKARQDAIKLLDAEVTSTDGTHVTVKVTEADGVITAVNVTESNIASTQALATETKAREDADKAINNKIGTVENGKTVVAMINAEAERATAAEGVLATRVTANETAITTLNGDSGTTGSVANAVAAETTRAQGVESGLANRLATVERDYLKSADKTELSSAISTEQNRAEGVERGLDSRLDVIEGKGDGSIKKALADAKSYTDTQIDGLTSTVTGDGTHVDVTVAQKNGVITAVTVSESDIASAAVLAKVKGEVDNFFKDASFADNAKDTLRELQEYINTDAAGALTMETAIAKNKTAIEDEVARATAAEQANTDKIAILNGDASTNGSVAKAVAAEQTRAMAAEKANADAITTETQNRTNAINALNATAGTQAVSEGKHVAVQVVEEKGKLTNVKVTEKDIASANELDALKAAVGTGFSSASTVASAITANQTAITNEANARTTDVNAINAKIGDVPTDKTVVEMINEAKAAAIAASTVVTEDSEFITIEQSGEVGKTQTYKIKTQDVASATATTKAINDEVTRAKDAESGLTTAINTEAQTRASEDTAIKGRLAVLEGVKVTGKDAIVVSSSDAKTNKEVSLKLGTQPSDKKAGVVLSQDANGLVAKLQWGTF